MEFSTNWKKSVKPNKQVKYRVNAPLHLRGKFLRAHLSEDLSKKYGKTSVRVVTGDKVKIMSGQFSGKSGKLEEIDTKRCHGIVTGIEFQKMDGTKIRVPVKVSKMMITELNLTDKKRQDILKRK